jgi:hypothetical protein
MQLILFLLGLFVIGCVLYGISAGVHAVTRGASRLASGSHASKADSPRDPPTRDTLPSTSLQPAPSHSQRCLRELQELYGLHQSGALSKDEFEQFKRYLLSTITHTSQENS